MENNPREATFNSIKEELKSWTFKINENEDEVQIGRHTFKIREINLQQIQLVRKFKIPSLLIKYNDKFYYSKIERNTQVNITPCHKCANCAHLFALSPEEGGCMKVIFKSTGLERFDFIKSGYETIGTCKDAFIVFDCANFDISAPRSTKISYKDTLKI